MLSFDSKIKDKINFVHILSLRIDFLKKSAAYRIIMIGNSNHIILRLIEVKRILKTKIQNVITRGFHKHCEIIAPNSGTLLSLLSRLALRNVKSWNITMILRYTVMIKSFWWFILPQWTVGDYHQRLRKKNFYELFQRRR